MRYNANFDTDMMDNLRRGGYPEARLADGHYHRWTEVHRWCEERFGNRYAWCGQQFFFTGDEDRVLFTMRWG
jgi:hypothetical protein